MCYVFSVANRYHNRSRWWQKDTLKEERETEKGFLVNVKQPGPPLPDKTNIRHSFFTLVAPMIIISSQFQKVIATVNSAFVIIDYYNETTT